MQALTASRIDGPVLTISREVQEMQAAPSSRVCPGFHFRDRLVGLETMPLVLQGEHA